MIERERIIRELAARLRMSRGELIHAAVLTTEDHRPIRHLHDLSRQEADRLIVYLDSLMMAGVR